MRLKGLFALFLFLLAAPAQARFEPVGYFSMEGNDGWLRQANEDKETGIQDYHYANLEGTSNVWVRVHGGGRPMTADDAYYHASRLMEGRFERVSRVFRGHTRRVSYTGARFRRFLQDGMEIRVIIGIGGARSAYHLMSTTVMGDSGNDPAMGLLKSFRGFMPSDAPGVYEPLGDIIQGDPLTWLGSDFLTLAPEPEVMPLPQAQWGPVTPSAVLAPPDSIEKLFEEELYPAYREDCEAVLTLVDSQCRSRGCGGGWGAGRCTDCPGSLPAQEREFWIGKLRARVQAACSP